MFQKKSNIAIIGAGNLASSLTNVLTDAGYNINCIISRNLESAKNLAKKTGVKKYSNDINDIPSTTNIFFLTVPDLEIKKVALALSKKKLKFSGSLFVHFSGAETISVLNPLKDKKGITASMHIMQSFPSRKAVQLDGCFAAIETDNSDAAKYLYKLAYDLLLSPFKIKSNEKVFYHIAGVFASNFLTSNMQSSVKLIEKSGLDKNSAFTLLKPIVYSTLQNFENKNFFDALSGPVKRGDIKTIKKHLSALKKQDENLYRNYVIQSINLLAHLETSTEQFSKEHKRLKNFLNSL